MSAYTAPIEYDENMVKEKAIEILITANRYNIVSAVDTFDFDPYSPMSIIMCYCIKNILKNYKLVSSTEGIILHIDS